MSGWRKCSFIFVTVGLACGSSVGVGDHDGGGGLSSGPKCSAEATILVDSTTFAAMDSGAAGVTPPNFGITETDIFYELTLMASALPGGLSASTGTIMRVPIRGGKPRLVAPVVGGGVYGVQGLAVTASRVVFSQAGGPGGGAVVSVPLVGGATTVLAAIKGAPGPVIADEENVYFVDDDGTNRVPVVGGAVAVVSRTKPYSLAVIGDNLILADFDGGMVLSVPTLGGTSTVLATQERPLFPLACGRSICWMNNGAGMGADGSLFELTPGEPLRAIAMGPLLSQPLGLVFDGTTFYATAGSPFGNLVKISNTGSSVVELTAMAGLSNIAVDDECVYWSSFNGILSQAK